MKLKWSVIWVILICIWQPSNAQTEQTKKNQWLKFAESALQMGDYISQAKYLETYLKEEPNDLKIKFQLGEAFLKDRNFKDASKLFLEVHQSGGKNEWIAAFYYSQCQKSMGNYQEAITYLKACMNNSKNRMLVKQARQSWNGCRQAVDSIKNFREVTIHRLNNQINSRHLDISPFLIDDQTLLYVSNQTDSAVKYTLDGSQNIPPKVFKMAHKSGNSWIPDNQTFITDNLGQYDVSGGVLSSDGLRFYFTVSEKDWKNKTLNSIFVSYKENGSWLPPVPLPPDVNLKGYNAVHLCVGETYDPDLEAIYFSSDRPEGYGGMDIWYTVYNKKRKIFIPPRNCGSKINSSDNEVTPFYQSEIKTLFFSSDALDGFGGFDVYKSVGSTNDWTRATPLEHPLNGNSDEIYYSLNTDLTTGFLVSNRLGALTYSHDYCCYDIYSFEYKEKNLPTIQGKILLSINQSLKKYLNKGIKIRPEDSVAIYKQYYQETQAKLYLIPKTEDNAILVETRNLSDTGSYTFTVNKKYDYKIDIEHGSEVITSIEVNEDNLNEETVITPSAVPIAIIPRAPIEIENIYYELNASELTNEAKANLRKTLIPLLNDLDEIHIEILSHTDSIGSEEYNLDLSQQRADNVRRFLINEGISSRRIESHGLGESHFIAPNSLPDGSDNPEGRRMNRRTEFVIEEE